MVILLASLVTYRMLVIEVVKFVNFVEFNYAFGRTEASTPSELGQNVLCISASTCHQIVVKNSSHKYFFPLAGRPRNKMKKAYNNNLSVCIH